MAVKSFRPVLLAFAGFLVFSSYKMLTSGDDDDDDEVQPQTLIPAPFTNNTKTPAPISQTLDPCNGRFATHATVVSRYMQRPFRNPCNGSFAGLDQQRGSPVLNPSLSSNIPGLDSEKLFFPQDLSNNEVVKFASGIVQSTKSYDGDNFWTTVKPQIPASQSSPKA